MTPQRIVAQARLHTPLGPMTAAATEQGLAGLWFDGQAHHPGPLAAPEDPGHRWLAAAAEAVADYFAGRHGAAALPLDLQGTPFQQAVWQCLQAIPAGQTRSYATIAARAGRPQAVRAVGAAVGRNPVSVLVPCHRVLGSDGALTGYAGGLPRKRALLALEGVAPA
ncbi:MAG: methylated-DNA--[protein]-cysteine S-methyltransferase [Burkholderiales bacterium]|nr:methylated-DNA--[protein]-cysteine S-methyltransferase [Burkholderiales bacterium]